MSTNRELLAIDPGTEQSGWCILRNGKVDDSGVSDNEDVLRAVYAWPHNLAIEMIASYGMAVGREVFETCVWIGRFVQAHQYPETVRLVYRKDVKLHLCGTTKAKDPNVRQALIDLFGGKEKAVGRKATPGPLYGVKSHAWPALGVAVTAAHQMKEAA
jgi:Holliday junction resolvasome RuvABC endonuclease subunit